MLDAVQNVTRRKWLKRREGDGQARSRKSAEANLASVARKIGLLLDITRDHATKAKPREPVLASGDLFLCVAVLARFPIPVVGDHGARDASTEFRFHCFPIL